MTIVNFVLYSLTPSSIYQNVIRVRELFHIRRSLCTPYFEPPPLPFHSTRLNLEYLYIYIHPRERNVLS